MAAELVLHRLGVRAALLGGAALLAPGLALAPLLPAAMRAHRVAAWAASLTLGFVAVTAALITIAWIGVELNGLTVRLVLAALLLAAIALWPARGSATTGPAAPPVQATAHRPPAAVPPAQATAQRPPALRRADLAELAGLVAVVAGAVALALIVVGQRPVPGNDWAKYLLYADEIRRHGALLIDNPYWMLGVPFREDPGVPAAYGAVLLLTGVSAGAIAQGILVFSVLQVLAVHAYVRAYWGVRAGLLAAALLAAVPASQGILGWHGLANVAALAILAVLLGQLAALGRERLDLAATAGLALVLVGLLATHRLTAVIAAGTIVLVAAAQTVSGRPGVIVDLARAGALAVVLGFGVIADVAARQRTFGGTLPASAYEATTIDLELAVLDLSWVLSAAALAGLLALIVTRRLERALWPAVALGGVCVALGYSHVVDLPMYYERVIFFLPLALAPIAAVAAHRLLRPNWVASVAGIIAVAVIAAGAVPQARTVRDYYRFADAVSVRGLDALGARLRPGEVVVTDRCWSFLSTWLLATPTLPALEPQDIQPKAELVKARIAREILRGSARGRALARRYGVRYAVVDPTCPDAQGRPIAPPRGGRAEFAARRVAIIRLRDAR